MLDLMVSDFLICHSKCHFWARKDGHFCQIWFWQLLNSLHTSQFISEVMLEFWQQLPFLVNMERGLIQLLHTHIASVTWRREGLPYLPYTGSPTTSSPIYGADCFAYGWSRWFGPVGRTKVAEGVIGGARCLVFWLELVIMMIVIVYFDKYNDHIQ